MDKPFSQACINNRGPISGILERVFADKRNILEIGSGTGQHAVWFASKMPHLSWQTSDQAQYHGGINQWIGECPSPNLLAPISLNVLTDPWPTSSLRWNLLCQYRPYNALGGCGGYVCRRR